MEWAVIGGITLAVIVIKVLTWGDRMLERRKIRRFVEEHTTKVTGVQSRLGPYEIKAEYTNLEKKTRKTRATNEPPRFARLMVRYLMSYKDQEPLLGDLTEMYEEIRAQDGVRAANNFYISQVVRSVFAQLKRVGIFVLLGDIIRRIIS